MKAEHVTVVETRNGGLRIFVADYDTDSLIVINVNYLQYYQPQHLSVGVTMRGNYSGSTRYGCPPEKVRKAVHSNMHIEAPSITPWELATRKSAVKESAGEESRGEPDGC